MPVRMRTSMGMTRTSRPASFTSLAWIFLPRYSGVRPTMRPPMNTAMMAKARIVYMPAPGAARGDLAEHHAGEQPMPPIGVNESFEPVTEPVEVCVDTTSNSVVSAHAEARLLALHVAARLVGHPGLGDGGVAAGLGVLREGGPGDEEDGHRRREPRRPGGCS